MIGRTLRRIAPGFHPTRWTVARRALLRTVSLLRPETMLLKAGYRLTIPKDDRSYYTFPLWWDGEYEPGNTALMRRLLRPKDVVVDIGANVGIFTCLFAKCVGPQGTVHAFEPEARNAERLRANLALNGFDWVRVHEAALGARAGRQAIYLCDENRGDHTLIPQAGRPTAEIEVETFDAFAQRELGEQSVRLVKMDVQGYEARVLEGMTESLRTGRVKTILAEFTPSRAREAGDDPANLFTIANDCHATVRILGSTVETTYPDVTALRADLERLAENEFAAFDLLIETDNARV